MSLWLFYHQSPCCSTQKRPTSFFVDRLLIRILSILYSNFDSSPEHYRYHFLIFCSDTVYQPTPKFLSELYLLPSQTLQALDEVYQNFPCIVLLLDGRFQFFKPWVFLPLLGILFGETHTIWQNLYLFAKPILFRKTLYFFAKPIPFRKTPYFFAKPLKTKNGTIPPCIWFLKIQAK